MNTGALLAAFADWRRRSTDLVLASVYDTAGSTYSKTGARMLITGDGRFRGMLSGGCLEGDLAERAAAVSKSGEPQTVTYDLGKNDEELWGLGVGCDGLMRIFLQPVTAANDWQPFAAMADVYAGDATGIGVTVLESAHESLSPGATLTQAGDTVRTFGFDERLASQLSGHTERALADRVSLTTDIKLEGRPVKLLFALLEPPPRILVLGAGLDAEPVVRLIDELGWRQVVQDHRPAYVANGDFGAAEEVLNLPVAELGDALDLSRYHAAIVMSHHLETDRAYLRLLAGSDIPYVGLLGPPDRRRRLLTELGDAATALEGRVQGPAGIDIGGRGPASIALSIVAEIHRQLMR